MCSPKYLPLANYSTLATGGHKSYERLSNYILLHRLSVAHGVKCCPSKLAIIAFYGLSHADIKVLVDKALNYFLRTKKLSIPDELILENNLGQGWIDTFSPTEDTVLGNISGTKTKGFQKNIAKLKGEQWKKKPKN